MRPLQMVDTKTQYQKIKPEIDAAVIAVMESSQFIGGKVVNDFAAHLATSVPKSSRASRMLSRIFKSIRPLMTSIENIKSMDAL